MGDSTTRPYNRKFHFRTTRLPMDSARSRRVQRAGYRHYDRLHELPAIRPETAENTSAFGAGTSTREKEAHFASSYGRMEGRPELNLSEGYNHAFSRVSFSGLAQNHGNGNSISFPPGRIASNGFLAAEGQMMNEIVNEVNSNSGLPPFTASRNQLTISSSSVMGRGSSGSSIYHGEGLQMPVGRLERQNFWGEDNADHIGCESGTSRGTSKRKISALNGAHNRYQNVCAQFPNFPGRSRSAISRIATNGRRNGRHFSSNSAVTNYGSGACQTTAPVIALPEVVVVNSSEEPICAQGRGFLSEISTGDSETLQNSDPFGTPFSADNTIQGNRDNGGTGLGHSFVNSMPAYLDATQAENIARVDPWPVRMVQSVTPRADPNLACEPSAHLSSGARFSRSHGVLSSPIVNHGRENISPSHLIVSGGRYAENNSTYSIGQLSTSNQFPSEESTSDTSFERHSLSSFTSDPRHWTNSYHHQMSSVNVSSSSSLSDHPNRRFPPCPPWTQSRQVNCLTTPPACSLPGQWSTTTVPLEGSHGNHFSASFGRHPSSAHIFGGHPIASSTEGLNVQLPSAMSGMPFELPPHRMYRFQPNDHRRRNTSGGVAEQILMLEATAIYGGLHDQYSDWRLDVDNMSYEDLLALEERIGNVCTGISEDVICKKLVTRKFSSNDAAAASSSSQDTEVKCSICQEEYEEEHNLGRLECGHSYHVDCIKQWLVQKNVCPVCKASAFS